MASGSTLCPSCRKLVGINDETCYNCGRKSPGKRNLVIDMQKKMHNLGMAKLFSATCVVLYLAMLVWDMEGIRSGGMSFLSPSIYSSLLFGASGSFPLFELGRWFTPFSAMLLHGGLLHILFNLYWLNMFYPNAESIFGSSRAVIGFTAGSLFGFVLTSVMGALIGPIPLIGGANVTLGASAGLFSLLGMFVATGGSFGRMMISYALIFFYFGIIFPRVDNWAHAGGFIGGYFIAQLFQRLPRNDRLEGIISVLCIVLALGSVVASVILNLPHLKNL